MVWNRNKKNLRNYFTVVAGVIAVFLAILAVQCSHEGSKKEMTTPAEVKFKNLNDTVGYVGMNTCKQCHPQIHQNFIKTGMGQSFSRASRRKSDGKFPADDPVYDPYRDFYYRPFWKRDSLYVLEFRIKEGDTVYKRTQSIDYIIGSGHHTNSHIYQVNGYLYQAPFTFYTQEGTWDLPPGFERGNNTRFSRKIGLECLSCHNAYPGIVEGSINKYHSVPPGIDCERCHGPGELHVKSKQERKGMDIKNDTDFTIVNPAKLPFGLQNEVCQRCHLQGNAILRKGKSFLDFKPGMKLSEIFEVFMPVYEDQEESFIMASHPRRLKKSECFRESRKKAGVKPLTCISCHNPHESVRSTKINFFNNKCKNCHNSSLETDITICKETLKARNKVNDNCVKCHMPGSGTFDIPHVTVTDHYISVPDKQKKAGPRKTGKGEMTGLKCMTSDSPDVAMLVDAYLYFFEKFSAQQKFLDSARSYLKKLSPDDHLNRFIHYHYLNQDFGKIAALISRNGYPFFPEAQTNYQAGQAFDHLGDFSPAEKYYKKAIALQPLNLDFRNKIGTLYLKIKKLKKAKDQYRFILKENPKMKIANNNLGFLYLAENKLDSARIFIHKTLSLDPGYPEAHLNLAKWYLGKGHLRKAKEKLRWTGKNFPEMRSRTGQILSLIEKKLR